MDERSLQGLISSLIPDEIEGLITRNGEQQSRTVELLKTAAGQAGGEADVEINNFLHGRGALLETTRAAAERSGSSASRTVAEFLTSQLQLSPALARIIAPLLVSLLPGISKLPGSGSAAKPKPNRKKPKPSSTTTAHQAKPTSPASSKPKKPKTSTSKKPAAKPKRRGRAGEIPTGEAQEQVVFPFIPSIKPNKYEAPRNIMPKTILMDRDIEDQARQGIRSIAINGDIVLTDLAYEKARQLGINLISNMHETPPAAPVRPYLADNSSSADIPRPAIDPAFSPSFQTGRNLLRFSPLASEAELRAAIIETGKIAYEKGLMVSNDGNISARLANGNILVTPAGVCKGRISPEDLLIVDINGKLLKPAADPALKPTSEQSMHLEVYRRRPDVRAVIHTHLVFANALAISKGMVRMDVIPEAAMSFGDVPVTNFSMPSSAENAEAIHDLIANHDVILVRNHGSLTVGKNLDDALIHVERLEHVAKTLTFSELLGDVHTLPPEMLDAIRKSRK